jgi:phosphatidylglycerophosphate synthase
MIDNRFRALLPKYVKPLVKLLAGLGLSPNQVTLLGLGVSLFAALAVGTGFFALALALWWLSRLFDALDGIYARAYNKTSDFGAFLDIQMDMLAYSTMIIGLYWQFPEYSLQWMIILLCYVLCISGALGLGSFENTHGIDDSSGRGLRIATGLAEGGETGIAYTVFLLFPGSIAVTSWIWISILAITIVSRIALAQSELKEPL